MKRITVSALALAVACTGAAVAQEMTEGMAGSGIVSADDMNRLIRSETIIGSPIYTISADGYEGAWEDSEYYAGWQDTDYYEERELEWEQVGEVSDIVLSRNGQLSGVIVEVGGFLSLGESEVILDLRDLKVISGGAGVATGDPGVGVGEENLAGGDVGAEEGVIAEEGGIAEEGLMDNEAVVEAEGLGAATGVGYGQIAFVTRYSGDQLENMEAINEGWF